MVRAEFELSMPDCSWEDAVEVGDAFVANDPELEGPPGVGFRFDPNLEARRIEDWIAFNLDESADPDIRRDSASQDFLRTIDRLRTFKPMQQVERQGSSSTAAKPREASTKLWPRFQLARKRGIAIVRLIDQSLVKIDHIEELASNLFDLIDAGNHRVVLNFGGVERIGSLVAAVLSEAQRKCLATEGGSLRICLLRPQLSGLLMIPGLARSIPSFPNEMSAVENPWPARQSPRPLPVEILSFLKLDMNKMDVDPSLARNAEPRVDEPADGPPRIWLISKMERGKTRSIGVSKSRFIIGRDPSCHLQVSSHHVSKRHAAIERRGGLTFIRDLGSTNGTFLNGRLLRKQEAELRRGDRIGIGDRRFVVAAEPAANQNKSLRTSSAEEMIIDWVRDPENDSEYLPLDESAQTLQDFSIPDELNQPSTFKYEVIEDVLVVTPRIHRVADESDVAALRGKLQELFNYPLPRRVVVSLEFVSELSPQAIGALLAHHLRLERAGGALRVCNTSHKLTAFLERIHFGMLMDCYSTLDDAILVGWQ